MRWVNFIMVLEQCSMHERQPYLSEWHLCLIPERLLSWYEIPLCYRTPKLITILTEGALYTLSWFIRILKYLFLIVPILCEIPWPQLCIHLLISSCCAYIFSTHPIENFCLHCIWKHLSLWSFPVRQEFWTKFFSYPCSWSVSQSVVLSALRNDIPCNPVQFWSQYSFWAQDHLCINRLLHI